VSDGSHHLIVSVVDAAGNAAPVLDRTITVTNAGAPGTSGRPTEQTGRTEQTIERSDRDERSDRPKRSERVIAGYADGALEEHSRRATHERLRSRSNSRRPPHGTGWRCRSQERGSTSWPRPRTPGEAHGFDRSHDLIDRELQPAPAGRLSSRTLRFAYRSNLGDTVPVAVRTLTLSVRAGVVLSVAPRWARVGRSIVLAGRLLGGSIPRGGKQWCLRHARAADRGSSSK